MGKFVSYEFLATDCQNSHISFKSHVKTRVGALIIFLHLSLFQAEGDDGPGGIEPEGTGLPSKS